MILTTGIVCAAVFLLVLGGGIALSVAGKVDSWRVIVLAWGLFSAGLLAMGCVIGWDRYSFAQKATPASGEVIDPGESQTQNEYGQWVKSHTPRIRFFAAQGRQIEFRGPTVTNGSGYPHGARVEVMYQADHPENARLRGFDFMWLVAAGLGFMGAAFSGILLRSIFQGSDPGKAA